MSVISLLDARKKRENTSGSKSQSELNSELDSIGPLHINPEDEYDPVMMVAMVVDTARFAPFTTKSGFARMAANEIAIAASEGFISTQLSESSYCNKWMVTADGLEFLKEVMHEAAPRH